MVKKKRKKCDCCNGTVKLGFQMEDCWGCGGTGYSDYLDNITDVEDDYENSRVEIRVFDNNSDKVAYHMLTKGQMKKLNEIIDLQWM